MPLASFGAPLALALTFAASAGLSPPEAIETKGVPPIPASIAEKAAAYAEARAASLLTFHPARREMLIATRFADVPQIHRVSAPMGARTQLTFFPDRVGAAAYPPAADRADHFVFSKDSGGGEFYQLYRYDLADAKITLLTDGKSRNVLGPYARDGRLLAYTSTRRNGKDTDLYVIDPRDPSTDRRVAEVEGGGWEPLDVSPDGKKLLVLEYRSVNDSDLWLFDVGTGAREKLTERPAGEPVAYAGGKFAPDGRGLYTATDRDGEFMRLAFIDLKTREPKFLSSHISWDVDTFDLDRRGTSLAVVTNEDGRGVLHLFDARTGKEKPKPKLPEGSVGGVQFHENGRDLGLVLGTVRSPSDAYTLDLRSGKVERWTASEVGPFDPNGLREPELVRFPSFDGRTISAWLYLPPARFAGKRPVVVNVHGGPESQARPGFLARNNYYLLELGVALLYPNVRGSTGYGKTFTKLDNGERREDSVKDIGALFDWLPTRPELDPARVMVMGGSYGGYMSYAVSARYADRIRCSVSVVGIGNFVTFLERTEAYRRDLRRVEYGDERDPKMRAFLTSISPTKNVASIRKPILIVQGKNDPRVPLFEAEQMVAELGRKGTVVWYVMAKDEGHGFAKKRNADFQLYTTIAFAERFLLASD